VVTGFVGEQTPMSENGRQTTSGTVSDVAGGKGVEGEPDDQELLAKFLMENL
jgi:hypothetical protein